MKVPLDAPKPLDVARLSIAIRAASLRRVRVAAVATVLLVGHRPYVPSRVFERRRAPSAYQLPIPRGQWSLFNPAEAHTFLVLSPQTSILFVRFFCFFLRAPPPPSSSACTLHTCVYCLLFCLVQNCCLWRPFLPLLPRPPHDASLPFGLLPFPARPRPIPAGNVLIPPPPYLSVLPVSPSSAAPARAVFLAPLCPRSTSRPRPSRRPPTFPLRPVYPERHSRALAFPPRACLSVSSTPRPFPRAAAFFRPKPSAVTIDARPQLLGREPASIVSPLAGTCPLLSTVPPTVSQPLCRSRRARRAPRSPRPPSIAPDARPPSGHPLSCPMRVLPPPFRVATEPRTLPSPSLQPSVLGSPLAFPPASASRPPPCFHLPPVSPTPVLSPPIPSPLRSAPTRKYPQIRPSGNAPFHVSPSHPLSLTLRTLFSLSLFFCDAPFAARLCDRSRTHLPPIRSCRSAPLTPPAPSRPPRSLSSTRRAPAPLLYVVGRSSLACPRRVRPARKPAPVRIASLWMDGRASAFANASANRGVARDVAL